MSKKWSDMTKDDFDKMIRDDPLKMMDLIKDLPNMDVRESFHLQQMMESAFPNDTPPFPSRKAKKTIDKILRATKFEVVTLNDVHKLHCWCKEDFYMESITSLGGFKALDHILQLCIDFAQKRADGDIKTKISEDSFRKRMLTLYSVADVLLNENNRKTYDLTYMVDKIVDHIMPSEVISKGFPMDLSSSCFAIKALGEVLTTLSFHHNMEKIHQTGSNRELMLRILCYVNDEEINTPLGIKVSSIMCIGKFLNVFLSTYPPGIPLLNELGFLRELKILRSKKPSMMMLVESAISVLQGGCVHTTPGGFFPSGDCHTKTQIKNECILCGLVEDPKNPLKVCSSCKSVRYCSRKCQVNHWKSGHSKVCKQLAAERKTKKEADKDKPQFRF